MNAALFLIVALLVSFPPSADAVAEEKSWNRIAIQFDKDASPINENLAELIKSRIESLSKIVVRTGVDRESNQGPGELLIWIGVADEGSKLKAAIQELDKLPPSTKDPGPEGFLLVRPGDENEIIAAGVDARGVLYAAGEILRRMIYFEEAVSFPEDFALRTAPAFEVRGTEVSQGHTMLQLTGAREWTDDEWRKAALDYVLAGANTLAVGHVSPDADHKHAVVHHFGLKTLSSQSGNPGVGRPEWAATEAIGRKGHTCPSIPEARKAILEQVDNQYKNRPSADYIRFYSGDGGGCECDLCAPYGATYIRMCEEMAWIITKHHPSTKFFATNQKLDNEGDRGIFQHLRESPNQWLTALCYGPGSNAMGWMPGRRQDHRMDLFRYPAFGPMDRYLREMLHQLPPATSIVFFTDLTHWVYSQYGLMDHELIPDRNRETPPHWGFDLYENKPDPAMERVYNRRTFHARPRNYYKVFRETMRYGIGDVTYSEGHHDHFNQWMWQRLLWAPHKSLDEVVSEYATVFFGPEAGPLMKEAILQLEENLSTPIGDNEGVDRFYLLVEEAGWKMPHWRRRRNYLWRQYMQRAALDKYVQIEFRRQTALQANVEERLREALAEEELDVAFEECRALLEDRKPTPEMKRLKDETGRLGEESDEIFGVRNVGYFNLDHDFVGLGWLERHIESAADADAEKKREIARLIVHYEDPGEGGFYDDAGNPEKSPRLKYGWPYGDGGFSGSNRPSQRSTAFTTDEEQGVSFEYDGLDPAGQYRVRFTLVRPRHLPRFGIFQNQTSQSIFADGHLLAKDLELPVYESDFFEFEIPKQATADGKLRIWFEKSEGVGEGPRPQVTVWRNTGGWGTLVSEVWLMKE